MIDNPAYKGEWAPRKIANVDYFEDKSPADFTKIMGMGIELWTIQANIMFDNIYVGHSVADAKQLAEETWAIKSKLELEKQPPVAEFDADSSEDVNVPGGAAAGDFVQNIKKTSKGLWQQFLLDFDAFLNIATNDPLAAVKAFPSLVGLISSTLLLPVLILVLLMRPSSGVFDSPLLFSHFLVSRDQGLEEEACRCHQGKSQSRRCRSGGGGGRGRRWRGGGRGGGRRKQCFDCGNCSSAQTNP